MRWLSQTIGKRNGKQLIVVIWGFWEPRDSFFLDFGSPPKPFTKVSENNYVQRFGGSRDLGSHFLDFGGPPKPSKTSIFYCYAHENHYLLNEIHYFPNENQIDFSLCEYVIDTPNENRTESEPKTGGG